jgi:hypothetical protein
MSIMTASKRRIEKPRPNSEKVKLKSQPKVLRFPRKKRVYKVPSLQRFAGFSEDVREWLEEQDYSE